MCSVMQKNSVIAARGHLIKFNRTRAFRYFFFVGIRGYRDDTFFV